MAQLSTLGVITRTNIMSTIIVLIVLIALAVAIAFNTIYFRRQIIHHIQTHAHPEQARLRLLWVQFWFFAAITAAYSVCEGVMLTRGEDKAPARAVVLFAVFVWSLISVFLKIRGCRKEAHKP